MELELLDNLLHSLDQMPPRTLVFLGFLHHQHTNLAKSIHLFVCAEIRTSAGMQLDSLVGNSLEELGITKHSGPRYSTYATLEARLKSFNHWPSHLKQTPRAMAQAGFFHLGNSCSSSYFVCFSLFLTSLVCCRYQRPCQLFPLWIGIEKLGTRRRSMVGARPMVPSVSICYVDEG